MPFRHARDGDLARCVISAERMGLRFRRRKRHGRAHAGGGLRGGRSGPGRSGRRGRRPRRAWGLGGGGRCGAGLRGVAEAKRGPVGSRWPSGRRRVLGRGLHGRCGRLGMGRRRLQEAGVNRPGQAARLDRREGLAQRMQGQGMKQERQGCPEQGLLPTRPGGRQGARRCRWHLAFGHAALCRAALTALDLAGFRSPRAMLRAATRPVASRTGPSGTPSCARMQGCPEPIGSPSYNRPRSPRPGPAPFPRP